MGGCGECLAKFGLISFNIIFMLSGIAVLGVGIWVKVDKNVVKMQDLIQFDSSDKNLSNAAWTLIGFGSFVLIVSAFGFLAACKQNKFFIGGYITFLVIIFCGEFAGGISAAVFKKKIDHDLPDILQKTFQSYQPGNTLLAKAWDYMQTWLSCCGSTGPYDYYGRFNHSQAAYRDMYVPLTCCILTNSNPESPTPKDKTKCEQEAGAVMLNCTDTSTPKCTYTALQKQGCYDSLNSKIKSHLVLIVGVGVGIGMFQLLGIVLAICVCKRDKDENGIY